MKTRRSFFSLQEQEDYKEEMKALIRRNDLESSDDEEKEEEEKGPPRKRPRMSQYSPISEYSSKVADGTIVSLTMENFMCHGNLRLEFNPRVNFLIGQNGSGKSAILTAITVGLGAQARETGRGKSLKDLVKCGESAATIIIELFNNNKRRVNETNIDAGKILTVKRTIGTSPGVQIKYQNKIISAKMECLRRLTRAMGIQVDNPICVLDQTTAKTFLYQSTSANKYQLFMRATSLKEVKYFHDEINAKIENIRQETQQKTRDLKHQQEFDKTLIADFKKVEALVDFRKERFILMEELLWSLVNLHQSQLTGNEAEVESANREYLELKSRVEANSEEDTFTDEFARLEKELEKVYNSKLQVENDITDVKAQLAEITASFRQENQENQKMRRRILSVKTLVTDYIKQIEKEAALGDPTERIKKQREAIENLAQEAARLAINQEAAENAEFEAHSSVSTLQEQLNQLRIDNQQTENEKNKIEREMRAISQDQTNLSIFGNTMPDVVRQINEDTAAGKFSKKPIGPLGLYIKLLDESCGPAVEAVIGGGLLKSFVVDNNEDCKKLRTLMRRICRGNYFYPIMVKRFSNRSFDTSRSSVYSPPYQNILDVIEISHPMVLSALIDYANIGRVLLIPDDATCENMMQDERRVPRNCLYSISKATRNTFYPAPVCKTHAGQGRNAVRFLKTSKEAALQNLELDLAEKRIKIGELTAQISEKIGELTSEKNKKKEIGRSMEMLRSKLQQVKKDLSSLRNQEEPEESLVVSLRTELRVREEELKEIEAREKTQREEMNKIKESADAKTITQINLESQYEELKLEERKLKDEKDLVEENRSKSRQQRETLREDLETVKRRIESLEERKKQLIQLLDKSKKDAEEYDAVRKRCSDPERSSERNQKKTTRKTFEVEKDLKAIDTKISTLESAVGDEDSIVRKYQEMKRRYTHIELILKRNKDLIKILHDAMSIRHEVYQRMMKMNKITIVHTFKKILGRNYTGSLDFTDNKMEINIGKSGDDARSTSTLSGGERSFGTMALLIALWYTTRLPFYFMDEFDVFMDMANRETIMSLMMDYTKRRRYQFCFLTPLNTNIQANKNVTIHRLEPPRTTDIA